jgi:geranylgeranyl pyrophosphate synthase
MHPPLNSSNFLSFNFPTWVNDLIDSHINAGEIAQAMKYALLPAGKLFRANLFLHLINDFKLEADLNQIKYICLAIELHHAYTLVHDDLPAMDNDDERRGKPSVHKQYNEWKAILIGDGLLNLSYYCLSQVENFSAELTQLFSSQLGANGLIAGQWMDLALTPDQNIEFNTILKIHQLKTSRLIEVAALSSLVIARKADRLNLFKIYFEKLGVVFQLLDDLDEIINLNLSIHEKIINPFLSPYKQKAIDALKTNILFLNQEKPNELILTSQFIDSFIKKYQQTINENQMKLIEHGINFSF